MESDEQKGPGAEMNLNFAGQLQAALRESGGDSGGLAGSRKQVSGVTL